MNSAQTWPDNKAQPSTVVTGNSQWPSSASQNLVSPWSLRVLCSSGAWTLRGVSGPTTGLCCVNVGPTYWDDQSLTTEVEGAGLAGLTGLA